MEFNFQASDLEALFGEVIEEFRTLVGPRQLTIRCAVHGMHVEASVDADKIKQVVRNLLSNAINFSPDGGIIELDLADDGQNLVVHVRDQGPGIPETELESIFDKFVQ